MNSPVIFSWNGEHMLPLNHSMAKLCDRQFVTAERYRLVEFEDRSQRSHNHYFASLKTAWDNLSYREAAIIARANGHCEKCEAILKAGEGEIDHLLACALGGDAAQADGRQLCHICHREKTTGDVRRICKPDRQRDKAA